MIQLPNGCKCSELKVNPSNWATPKATLKNNWYIYYRFYDPSERALYPKGKLRIVKGMNESKTLEERQALVKALMDLELSELKIQGFNPIIEKHVAPLSSFQLISPETPLTIALEAAFQKGGYKGRVVTDVRSVLKYVAKAAIMLRFDYVCIKEIKPSHIMMILEQCGKIKDTWTANTYNSYKKYLSILFGQLIQQQAIEFNPVRDIKKRKTVKQLREILTPDECQSIDAFTKKFDENLWRFIHIFFHSGSRTTEILRVQREHVNLQKQKVKFLVLKGQQHEWVERTIKDIALPLWKKALEGCGPNDFVFSKGLKPGAKMIRAEQVSRRWRTHIKKKLGIDCDFYSLKHLNTDQTATLLDLNSAAAQNSHKSTKITMTYAVNEKQRMHERLKGLQNGFA